MQVVNDDCRAQEGYRAERAWERDTWKAERDRGKANKVAQQVRRAAALTAELAAQSEKKIAAVCDQPPGPGELSGHIEAPKMEAGAPPPSPLPGHNDARPVGQANVIPQTKAKPRPALFPDKRMCSCEQGHLRSHKRVP